MTEHDKARAEATERLNTASRRLDAALEKLHTESFNCRVNGKVVKRDNIPNPDFMMPLHASMNEVGYAMKRVWDAFNDLDSATRNWCVLHNKPYQLDLVAYYNQASGV
jgi:hypothetical protein